MRYLERLKKIYEHTHFFIYFKLLFKMKEKQRLNNFVQGDHQEPDIF